VAAVLRSGSVDQDRKPRRFYALLPDAKLGISRTNKDLVPALVALQSGDRPAID
jgi:hypothetical protein